MARTREFLSRNGRRIIASAPKFERWNNLPYGRWTCSDGRTVWFNRFYEPILERRPGGPLIEADASEWISFTKQEWFYTDDDEEPAKRRKAKAALAQAMAEMEHGR